MELEIITGTYEDFIVGHSLQCNDQRKDNKKKYELIQSFAIRAHSGSVKTVVTSPNGGQLLASVGSDEVVNLFELNKRKLSHTFEGAINCFAFVDNTHLIAGSEDANIYIYELQIKSKSSAITQAKTLVGHKKSVTSISVHPSNKLLLSISKDNTLRTWNLIKGRSAYITSTKNDAHLIKWNATGDMFIIAAKNEIYLYQTNTGNLDYSLRFEKRVNSVEFLKQQNTLAVATDSGKLEFHDLKTKEPLLTFDAHDVRIKSVCLLDSADEEELLTTCSSDGTIKVWSLNPSNSPNTFQEPQLLTSIDTGARLTCMSTAKIA